MILTEFLKHIGNDESGATAVEYGLIVSLIVLALAGSLQALGSGNEGLWTSVQDASNEVMGN
ncbi:Flp family type IVb pilin [Erythrobacter sp. HL-111]|uniref:Flp family type IVb pilin n=1 Tax=Erythrobacter sp. HL-111 TaxID=1798193 RepID=UPI0006DB926A|nr:Flp family type IVb pilin [Erythrobacter sp. HL-111]KPP90297.1 MAG: pilus assembly protein Flp/PilA [Erythrobacteraceae bacterium HL-111]SDR84172.1 pilus assembly protein Flp/PilA [Erythrobacter sp. HL-111]